MRALGTLGAIGLMLLPAGAGCRRSGTAETAGAPALRGPRALQPVFRPPADGRLTGADLDLYVKVRRAAKGRPDADAARAVGADPDRFGWVQARVVEALVALDAGRVREDSAEVYARTLTTLRQTRRSVQDPQTVRALDARIAQLERERAGLRRADPLPPRVSSNAGLLASRRAEIDSVASP